MSMQVFTLSVFEVHHTKYFLDYEQMMVMA